MEAAIIGAGVTHAHEEEKRKQMVGAGAYALFVTSLGTTHY